MNNLLPSPTLIDLSLRRDLHLIVVLQVMASVPESFVEIGVWGGEKKKKPWYVPWWRERIQYIRARYLCLLVLTAKECTMCWKLELNIESLIRHRTMRRQNLLTLLFIELQFSLGFGLVALTSLSRFLGYQHIQTNCSARLKHYVFVRAAYFM